MDNELRKIIYIYINRVNQLCTNLLEGLGLLNKAELIRYLYMGKERVWELNINDVKYKFHGSGCDAFYGDRRIQWDFGRRSHWCGIDPWFVFSFIKDYKNDFNNSFDVHFIRMQCEKAVEEKEMYIKDGRYYFNIPPKETFCPQFPNEFDSLVIEYYDDSWTVPNNKEIMRFIRKSVFVYNLINNIEDKYILKFQRDNEVIYTIAYSDICYPENAVVIMTDRIISKLNKE